MSQVLMQKPGETDIYVDSSIVVDHEQRGWVRAKISVSADGQSLVVPYGTYIDFDSGALKLDGIQLTPSAAELNTLDTNADMLATVKYSIIPDAVSTVAVMAAANLTVATQNKTTGITNPDVPRVVTVKGNLSGIAGDVNIVGTNIANAAITEVIALNGATEVIGTKAFKTVTEVDLPGESHTSTAQVETATAAGTVTTSGNASVVVTAAGMTGTPKTISVAVLENDDANAIATKIRAALNLDAAVTALFTVNGATNKIILTRKICAANDTSLNIAIADGTSVGVSTAASSANTTAGVAYDTVSVGVGKLFGIPHIVDNATLLQEKIFNGSDDNGTLAVDADEIEKNLFSLDGTPNGSKVLELYYLQ
jgi:hypothetical protein